ncbi:uncharacterized protein LOC103573782 [Microplitis demolitor]|uniref:uncharacterized protein LOC103573782 n=1 Tax=Microplitis demolitor TaxID=69319 RepID=UPI0004CC9BE4|nr:uncharacterized protein LOC103573782 [Microplitis demolitor]
MIKLLTLFNVMVLFFPSLYEGRLEFEERNGDFIEIQNRYDGLFDNQNPSQENVKSQSLSGNLNENQGSNEGSIENKNISEDLNGNQSQIGELIEYNSLNEIPVKDMELDRGLTENQDLNGTSFESHIPNNGLFENQEPYGESIESHNQIENAIRNQSQNEELIEHYGWNEKPVKDLRPIGEPTGNRNLSQDFIEGQVVQIQNSSRKSIENQNLGGLVNVNQRPDGESDHQISNKQISNEWMVKIKYRNFALYDSGFFVGPRIFLTFSKSIPRNLTNLTMEVSNEFLNPEPKFRRIRVDSEKIFYGLELSKEYNESQRNLALIITDEPVIPASEIAENTFAKIASNINDVDLTNCMIPTRDTSKTSFYDCHVRYRHFINNNTDYFWCTVHGNLDAVIHSSAFFCKSKENSNTELLVGLATSGYHTEKATNKTSKTIINACGLNITSMYD